MPQVTWWPEEQVVQVSVCLPLTHTYRLGVLDEDLGAPHLVLVRIHVDHLQQMLDPPTLIPTPLWPRLGGQNGIPGGRGFGRFEQRAQRAVTPQGRRRGLGRQGASPLQELGELAAVGEARPAHPDVLLQAQVLHLVLDPAGKAA